MHSFICAKFLAPAAVELISLMPIRKRAMLLLSHLYQSELGLAMRAASSHATHEAFSAVRLIRLQALLYIFSAYLLFCAAAAHYMSRWHAGHHAKPLSRRQADVRPARALFITTQPKHDTSSLIRARYHTPIDAPSCLHFTTIFELCTSFSLWSLGFSLLLCVIEFSPVNAHRKMPASSHADDTPQPSFIFSSTASGRRPAQARASSSD